MFFQISIVLFEFSVSSYPTVASDCKIFSRKAEIVQFSQKSVFDEDFLLDLSNLITMGKWSQ